MPKKRISRQERDRYLKRRRRRRILLAVFSSFLLIFLVLGGVLFTVLLKGDQWKQFDPDKLVNLNETTWMYDAASNPVVSVHGTENRTKILIRSLPEHIPHTFVSAEDARFYTHSGIDITRIFGALWADIKAGSLEQGASTITQQLVKLTHLTGEKTWTRKLQEAILAFQLESHYTKDAILEMYLNVVYFGRGAYGIEAAAQSYFGVSAVDLTLEQSACLAACLKAPSYYAPHLYPDNNLKRRNMILDNMQELGYITPQQASESKAKPISIIDKPEETEFPHGWFMDQVITEAQAILNISGDEFLTGGYRIYTTMDENAQTALEDIYDNKNRFPENAADGTAPESAMVVLDTKTGAVRGIIGGREYTVRRGLNRATQSRRSPGSAFKPIAAYAPAIEMYDYSPVTMFNDEKTTFPGDYTPRNSGGSYHGWVTMREAIAKSYNVTAVKCLENIGTAAGREFALRLGIELDAQDNHLSMALGSLTEGVTPLELAGAYQTFGNGGVHIEPFFIDYIMDGDNNILYQHSDTGQRVMQEDNAYIMTNLLESVVTDGTGKTLRELDIPIAAKTGTNGYEDLGNRDIWMAAYNADYTVSVWMGYDITDAEHYLTDDVTGGGSAANLVVDFFDAMYVGRSAPSFSRPSGIVDQTIDRRVLEEQHIAVLATDSTPEKYRLREVFTQRSRIEADASDYLREAPAAVRDISVSLTEENYPRIEFTGVQEGVRYHLLRVEEDVSVSIYKTSGVETHSFVDEDVWPGTTYEYFVIGVDTGTEERGEESPHVFIQIPDESDIVLPEPEEELTPEGEEDWPWPEPTPIPTPEPDEEEPLPTEEPAPETEEPDADESEEEPDDEIPEPESLGDILDAA